MMDHLYEIMHDLGEVQHSGRIWLEYKSRHGMVGRAQVSGALNGMLRSPTYRNLVINPRRGWYGLVPDSQVLELALGDPIEEKPRKVVPYVTKNEAIIFHRVLYELVAKVRSRGLERLPVAIRDIVEPDIKRALKKWGISLEHDFKEAVGRYHELKNDLFV